MLQTTVEQEEYLQIPKEQALVLELDTVGLADISLVGGKNASLGEMIQQLSSQGVNVPTGFATSAKAYRYFIQSAGLEEKLRSLFADLDVEDVNNLQQRGKKARSLILQTPFPSELEQAIAVAYHKLCERYGDDTDVAVRSSATAEDLPDASFAGQQETYLNVHSLPAVVTTPTVKRVRSDGGFSNLQMRLAASKVGCPLDFHSQKTVVQPSLKLDSIY